MSVHVDVRAWLDARSPPAPPALRQRIDQALEAALPSADTTAADTQAVKAVTDALSPPAATAPESRVGDARAPAAAGRPQQPAPPGAASEVAIAEALAEAALGRLREALTMPEQRAVALDLLAADALLTYACEAAAEAGPDALVAFASAYGPTRFGRLLERV